MAPGSSSRHVVRRGRRAPSSEIEDDNTAPAGLDAVEDDDPQPAVELARALAIAALPGKVDKPSRSSKGKKKRAAADDSDDQEDDDEDEPLPELGNNALDKSYAVKVRGIASDWGAMRDKVHIPSYDMIKEVAAAVAEYTEGEKGEKAIATIDVLMRELLDTECQLTVHETVLNNLHQKLARNEEIIDIIPAYQHDVQQELATYSKKTTRQKYAKSEAYTAFRQSIYEVQHPEEAMPPVTDFIPREEGDDSDDDDDLQIGGVTQDYKCPLSLTFLVEPVTSKICNHSYSRSAIRDYLGSQTAKKTCPATGCRQKISMADMEVDKALEKRAKAAARREKAREESDSEDDDEVIE